MGRKYHGPGIFLLMTVMKALKESDDLSTRELIKLCGVTSYAFYRVINFLENNGLVQSETVRIRDRGKGSVKIYRLTPKGEKLYEILTEYINTFKNKYRV